MTCDIRIGTSGFHYKHGKGPFYPKKTPATKLSDFYVHHFDTVALNNGFYRLQPVRAAPGSVTSRLHKKLKNDKT